MYLFLSGAEMQPERVRGAWPEARFVARGRLEPRPLGAVAAPAGARYETWGIVSRHPARRPRRRTRRGHRRRPRLRRDRPSPGRRRPGGRAGSGAVLGATAPLCAPAGHRRERAGRGVRVLTREPCVDRYVMSMSGRRISDRSTRSSAPLRLYTRSTSSDTAPADPGGHDKDSNDMAETVLSILLTTLAASDLSRSSAARSSPGSTREGNGPSRAYWRK